VEIGLLFSEHLEGCLLFDFVMQIIWAITGDWRAGDFACRALMFFRSLGFYSSSFLLVTISLDRYFAIVHPFSRVKVANRRARFMIGAAWVAAILASAPQASVAGCIIIIVLFYTDTSICDYRQSS
jgi:hypothetical protein